MDETDEKNPEFGTPKIPVKRQRRVATPRKEKKEIQPNKEAPGEIDIPERTQTNSTSKEPAEISITSDLEPTKEVGIEDISPKKKEKPLLKKLEMPGLVLLSLGACAYLFWPVGPKESSPQPRELKEWANKPMEASWEVRREEARAINTPTPAPMAPPEPKSKDQMILDILKNPNDPDVRWILTTEKDSVKLVLVETRNSTLIKLLDEKKITPGTKIVAEFTDSEDAALSAQAERLKARPVRLKKLDVK